MHAGYVKAIIVGAVFSVPILACIWLAAFLRERAVADALSKGQGVFCVGLDIYLLFLLLIVAIFALAGIVCVAYAGELTGSAGEAGKIGGVAGATGVIVSVIVILAAEAYVQIAIDHNFSLPESPAAIAFLIIALLLYCLVPVISGASVSAFSGVLYYKLLHRAKPDS